MIHYLPFTFLDQTLVRQVVAAVGHIGLCQVAEALAPLHLRAWAAQKIIDLYYPKGLAPERLLKTVQDFRQWGALHEGRLAAMAALVSPRQGGLPWAEDGRAIDIKNLIQKFDSQHPNSQDDPVFRAGLFAAMAHLHDEYSADLHAGLDCVEQMQKQMVTQLTGMPAQPVDKAQGRDACNAWDRGEAPGLLLTEQRLVAWAWLAADSHAAACLYLTTSRAVFDALLDRFPEAVPSGRWRLPCDSSHPAVSDSTARDRLHSTLEALSTAPDPLMEECDGSENCREDEKAALLSIHILPGCRPQEMLARLTGSTGGESWPDRSRLNTLVGHLILPGPINRAG